MLNSSSSFFFRSSSVISCLGLLRKDLHQYVELIVRSVNHLLRHGYDVLPLVPPKEKDVRSTFCLHAYELLRMRRSEQLYR